MYSFFSQPIFPHPFHNPQPETVPLIPSQASVDKLLDRNVLESPFIAPRSPFRVMSYNILADSILKKNRKTGQHIDWEYRVWLVLDEIEKYDPDILCLQEVDLDNTVFYAKFVETHYIYYQKRAGDNQDGCMTLIKKSRFKVLESHYLEFLREKDDPLLCRYNVCLFTVLQSLNEKEKDHVLVVGNSHLLYNPKRGDIKTAQAYLSMKAIAMLADRYRDRGTHVIWAGDFNATPNGGIYEFIRKGKFDLRDLSTAKLSGQKTGELGLIDRYVSLEDFLKENIKCWRKSSFEREDDVITLSEWLSHLKGIELKIVSPSKEANISIQKIEYRMELLRRMIDDEGEETWILENDFPMKSAYGDFQRFYSGLLSKDYPEEVEYGENSSFEPLYTHKTEGALGTVDYVWYNTRMEHHRKSLKVIGVVEVPRVGKMWKNGEIGEMPNEVYPSDHVSLVVDFEIN